MLEGRPKSCNKGADEAGIGSYALECTEREHNNPSQGVSMGMVPPRLVKGRGKIFGEGFGQPSQDDHKKGEEYEDAG